MANLVKWSPLGGIVNLQDEVNDLFRDFFRGVDLNDGRWQGGWAPAVDVEETEEAFVVKADVPGMGPKDVKITLNDNVLTLSGERKAEKSEGRKGAHRTERTSGSFTRSFGFPRTVDPQKVKAAYREGVLTVTLPKKEEAKPHEIEVKVE